MSRRKDLYDAALETYRCCLAKQDIPEVEAVIALLEPSLALWWNDLVEQALRALEAELSQLEDDLPTQSVDALSGTGEERDRRLDTLIAILASIIIQTIRSPFPGDLEAFVRRSARQLLDEGASSISLPSAIGRRPEILPTALGDLQTLMSGRVETRIAELNEQIEDFLTNPAARGETVAPPATEGGATSRDEWRSRIRRLMGAGDDVPFWIHAATDSWAYRWFVLGQAEAGLEADVQEFVLVAVLDERTTRWCRWVNGRRVPRADVEAQVGRHIAAVAARDIEALSSNWPMLPSEIIESPNTENFEQIWRENRMALPPFHFGCRTVARPA